jgi:hypothetical protein
LRTAKFRPFAVRSPLRLSPQHDDFERLHVSTPTGAADAGEAGIGG